MSKSVRLPDYLAAEVERLAKEERRSLANMVKVLLEQALRIESSGATVGNSAVTGSGQVGHASPSEPVRSAPDSHFKPDPK